LTTNSSQLSSDLVDEYLATSLNPCSRHCLTRGGRECDIVLVRWYLDRILYISRLGGRGVRGSEGWLAVEQWGSRPIAFISVRIINLSLGNSIKNGRNRIKSSYGIYNGRRYYSARFVRAQGTRS
jgi:hypothetical protein